MKRLATLAVSAILAVIPAFRAHAQIPGIRTVYLMPMASGLDQHLANWITHNHVYQVVTDPRAADAFLTDRIGATFEQRMAEIFPPTAEEKEKDKPSRDTGLSGNRSLKSIASRGTIFLVEVKSRQVVWSDFEKSLDTTPEALDREAERITKKLAGGSLK